jgi:hypothetical protein
MRKAEAVLGIVRGSLGKVTGELIDTETVTISSGGGCWKSTCKGNSPAAYLTLMVSLEGGCQKSALLSNSLAAYPTARPVLRALGGDVLQQ